MIHSKRVIFIIIGLLIIFNGCNQSNCLDCEQKETTISGTVLDSITMLPIEGALIGFRRDLDDSVCFFEDSVVISSSCMTPIAYTQNEGVFEFNFWGSEGPLTFFDYLFVYKKGYKIWEFDKTRDTLINIDNSHEEILIRMVSN